MDSYTAVAQLVDYIKSDVSITSSLKNLKYEVRDAARVVMHEARIGESHAGREDGARRSGKRRRSQDEPSLPGIVLNNGGKSLHHEGLFAHQLQHQSSPYSVNTL